MILLINIKIKLRNIFDIILNHTQNNATLCGFIRMNQN